MSYTKSTENITESPPSYNENNYIVSDNDINEHLKLINTIEIQITIY